MTNPLEKLIQSNAIQTGGGVLETLAALGSGAFAEPVSGLAGLTVLASTGDPNLAARAVQSTQQGLTYQPRGAVGQGNLQGTGQMLQPVGEAMEKASGGLGSYVMEQTGSPALAAAAHSIPTAAAELIGAKGLGRVAKTGKQLELNDIGSQAHRQKGAVGGVRSPNALLDDLQNAADDLGLDYSEAFEVGGTIYYPEAWINKLSEAGKGGLRHEIARQNEKVLGALESRRGGLHGTNQDISSIDASRFGESTQAESAKGGFWTVDRSKMGPRTAGSYANYAATDVQVRKLMDEAEKAEKAGDWDLYDKKLAEAEALDAEIYNEPRRGQNIIPIQRLGKYKEIDMGGADFMDVQSEIHKAMESAKKDGFDGVTFKNLADEVGFNSEAADHTVTFDPSKIRSEFAALDPQFKKSKNILASPSSVALGGAYLYNKMQQEQSKN